MLNRQRPFLKWAGSKYNCLQHIVTALPVGKRLIEPFSGSGAVFMNTHFESYILGESNEDLIALYRILQQKGEAFIHYCKKYFIEETNNNLKYYEFREQFNQMKPSQNKSALFLYLNRHGYNGLCRYNSKGIFNVPFGLYKNPYFPQNEMMAFYQKSIHAHFIHHDFRETFKMAERGDIIYCDPPYVPILQTTKPLPYTPKKFDTDDQIELAELARETAAKGIPVVLSNHDTEFTRTHYKHALIKSFPVTRWINCQANKRQPVKELIAVFK